MAQGKMLNLKVEKTIFDEIAEDYLTDYKMNGRNLLKELRSWFMHLGKFFKGYRCINITTSAIKNYVIIDKNRRCQMLPSIENCQH